MTDEEIIYPTQERMVKDPMRRTATDAYRDLTWKLDYETELDRLKEAGLLGPDTERRYSAGIWLRALHIQLYPSEGVGAYNKTPIHETGEMTDQQSRNFKCYLDVQRELPRFWKVLHIVCCDGLRYPHIHAVTTALDALADHRGI